MQTQRRLDLIFVDRAKLGAMIIDPASGRDFTVVGTTDPRWTKSVSDYSFGRAAASGDYKVLHLVTSWHSFGPTQLCEVATIMDGGAEPTWRQRPWGPFFDATFSCEDKATINGVLYFMPYYQAYSAHARTRIAAFDLESEEWKPQMIKCPRFERKGVDAWRIALTEIKGTLCVVQNIHLASWGCHYVNIWLLTDHNKSIWVKEYRIQMSRRFFFVYDAIGSLRRWHNIITGECILESRESQELLSICPSVLQL
jgi:F-box interacting protein